MLYQSKLFFAGLFFSAAISFVQAEEVKIMPLGDSITYGLIVDGDDFIPEEITGGYRQWLWYMLEDANYPADFVGSQQSGYALSPEIDPDHEGHRGWTSDDIANETESFLHATPADIVLLHAGTNDVSTSVEGINKILNGIDRIEQETGRTIKVYVALLIDRQLPDPIIRTFNENLKALVGLRIRMGDNLTLVDMNGQAGLTSADYSDYTHPNASGYKKMAQIWFNALTGPETPGLYAYPYILTDAKDIHAGSVVVDYATNTVSFETDIPDNGITIY